MGLCVGGEVIVTEGDGEALLGDSVEVVSDFPPHFVFAGDEQAQTVGHEGKGVLGGGRAFLEVVGIVVGVVHDVQPG